MNQGSFRPSDALWPYSFLSLRNSYLKAKVAGLGDVDNTGPTGHCVECFMHINTGHKPLACVCAHTRVCRMTSFHVWSLGLRVDIWEARISEFPQKSEGGAELYLCPTATCWQPPARGWHPPSPASGPRAGAIGHRAPTLLHASRYLPGPCSAPSLVRNRQSNIC